MNKFQLDDPINILTHRIIGCGMQVHRALGNGFQEVIYQRALAIEFRVEGIEFSREQEMGIFYRNESIGTRRVDFLVEKEILVELKAVQEILDIHKAQAINYCEAYGLPHGLLIISELGASGSSASMVRTGFRGWTGRQDFVFFGSRVLSIPPVFASSTERWV